MSLKKIKLPDGNLRWEVIVYVGGKGSKMLRRRFETKIAAENFKSEFRTQKTKLKNLGYESVSFDTTSFRFEAENWLKKKRIEFSPSHICRVEGLLRHLLPWIGDMAPNKLTPAKLSDVQDELFRRGQRAPTIRRTTDLIRAVLNFSFEMRRIPFDPSAGFKPLKSPKKKFQFWEEIEAKKFLEYTDQKYSKESGRRWTHLIYMIALNTGMRAGEILGLKAKCLSGGGLLLKVEGQFDRVSKTFRPCKDNDERIVPCNESLKDEIVEWIAYRRLKPDDYLFAIEGFQPVDYNNLRSRYFIKDLRDSGVRCIRFHDMRHTAATLMISKQIDIKTVQEILGHSSVSTTEGYTHVLGESIRRVADVFSVVPNKTTFPKEPGPQLRLVR